MPAGNEPLPARNHCAATANHSREAAEASGKAAGLSGRAANGLLRAADGSGKATDGKLLAADHSREATRAPGKAAEGSALATACPGHPSLEPLAYNIVVEARKGWLGIFRPNLAGAILWLIILAVDVLLFSQARSTTEISLEPWDSYTEWQKVTGLPAVMKHQVTYREEEVVGGSTEVYWLTLLAVLTVTYFLAMALGNQIRIRSTAGVGRRMAITVASAVLLAFVASIGISQWMWNYPFARPNVLVDVKQIQEVSSISPVVLRGGRFEPIEGYSIQVEAKGNPQEGGYYNLSQRVLMSLKIHDKLPAKPRMADRATFANYLGALMQSGILVKSAEGYASSDELAGNVVEYKSLNGNDRVFMGVRGGQVSNDHYPYYEMLFAREGDKLRYLDSQMFYFDVAGMEGAEWHGFFQVLAILLTPLALAVHCVIEIARGMRSKSRLARSACRAS